MSVRNRDNDSTQTLADTFDYLAGICQFFCLTLRIKPNQEVLVENVVVERLLALTPLCKGVLRVGQIGSEGANLFGLSHFLIRLAAGRTLHTLS